MRTALSETVLMKTVGKNILSGWEIILGKFPMILWKEFILNVGKDRDSASSSDCSFKHLVIRPETRKQNFFKGSYY